MTALSLAIYGAGLAAIFVWYALPNLNRRLVVGALITILLDDPFGWAAFLALPFWAVHSLRQAIERGDELRVDSMIDWPPVRERLRAVLRYAFMQSNPRDSDSPLVAMLVCDILRCNSGSGA